MHLLLTVFCILGTVYVFSLLGVVILLLANVNTTVKCLEDYITKKENENGSNC